MKKVLYWIVVIPLMFALASYLIIPIAIYFLYRLVLLVMKVRYFKSEEFLEHKNQIQSMIDEYNEISDYIDSFDQISLQSSSADRYKYASLATYENTSTHNIKRDRNVKNISSKNVYQTSLGVVKKASEEPLKYLCKYFDFKPSEENLIYIQEMAENVSRFTNAEENLKQRLTKIEADFNPPKYILKHYRDELMKHLEIEIPKISFSFPNYVFEYVSAGGNSSQKTTITLNDTTIEALTEYIADQVARGKTAKAQRALMTKKLREYIKERDDYTCQNCQASVAEQSLLLLEVDHIIPVSKGGLSTEDNLQTLCWKCNRTKSDKIA